MQGCISIYFLINEHVLSKNALNLPKVTVKQMKIYLNTAFFFLLLITKESWKNYQIFHKIF